MFSPNDVAHVGSVSNSKNARADEAVRAIILNTCQLIVQIIENKSTVSDILFWIVKYRGLITQLLYDILDSRHLPQHVSSRRLAHNRFTRVFTKQ